MLMLSKKLLVSIAALSTFASFVFATEDDMVKSIMKLRGEVETLYNQIDDNKETYKSQMKSYTLQISDSEAQINRQETSLKLTNQNIEKTQKKLAALDSSSVDIKPMINDAIDLLVKEIKIGIPFKTEERIAALLQIKKDLKNGNTTQEKALASVWASYDDALRLTKEIGQFKQEITIDGKQTIAKIAKIGSVMMFFATPDEKVGYVKKEKDKYTYVTAKESGAREQIVNLFDALQKQIRTGYFTLPNALLLRGVN
ncbi:MAG: hypothetical protein QG564_1412 [Campylobacterota bacterium]|nr:hypothetical protein [Campylobacterota bacterium]